MFDFWIKNPGSIFAPVLFRTKKNEQQSIVLLQYCTVVSKQETREQIGHRIGYRTNRHYESDHFDWPTSKTIDWQEKLVDRQTKWLNWLKLRIMSFFGNVNKKGPQDSSVEFLGLVNYGIYQAIFLIGFSNWPSLIISTRQNSNDTIRPSLIISRISMGCHKWPSTFLRYWMLNIYIFTIQNYACPISQLLSPMKDLIVNSSMGKAILIFGTSMGLMTILLFTGCIDPPPGIKQ
jgi:hypothetical protein